MHTTFAGFFFKSHQIEVLEFNMEKVCTMCKMQGADVNNVNIVDQKGFTSLMNAVYIGHYQCVRILLDAGADVNIAGANGITALMLATGADVNLVDKQGATPLILVAQKYNSEDSGSIN